MLTSYRQLSVWQKSIDLVIEIYHLTKFYPKEELYGLTSQSRRASVSLPSNIAEGYTRKHRPEYVQFLRLAFSSGAELETQLLIARKLVLAPIQDEVMKMLNGPINTLVAKP